MFDIGFWEIVLVMVIALIVVGPERLPTLARTVGLWLSKAQRMMTDVRGEVERELNIQELRRSIAQPEALQEMRQLADRVKSLNTELQADVRKATLLDTPMATPTPPPAVTSSPTTTAMPTTNAVFSGAPPALPADTPLSEFAAPTPLAPSPPATVSAPPPTPTYTVEGSGNADSGAVKP